jgi:hypothetical protein
MMELHAYRMKRRDLFFCRHHIVDAFFSALTISTITTPGVINATAFRRIFLFELRPCCSRWSYAHAAFDGSRRCTGTELGKAGGSSAV